ncbi:splicing factor, proline- and glutamine-rich isoform X2 [Nematostella vectensis]|nr:splicing factor, proline- and glutamine-rich isoform X2 [Nematostella vectensis]
MTGAPSTWEPMTGAPSTWEPWTDGPGPYPTDGPGPHPSHGPGPHPSHGPGPHPSHGPGPHPSSGPGVNWFGRFLRLLHNSVKTVKADEHPDLKYREPGEKFVEKLLEVRKALIQLSKPGRELVKLMIKDHVEMMQRVHQATQKDDIHQAKHVVGEYFIAINRRISLLAMHAASKGLFDDVGDMGHKELKSVVKRSMEEHHAKAASAYFMRYFNEYRVSDGLLDGPFVKMGVETVKETMQFVKQMIKSTGITKNVYFDMLNDLIRLSVDMHNHHGAVDRAGAGVLSIQRRCLKVHLAVHQAYASKQCPAARQ